MSYVALYRKWRPLVFQDVVEQEHVVKTIKHSIGSGRIAHAYLFCGTRGTGKTTMAKIFSRAINCLSPENGDPCNKCEICKGILSGSLLDVIEIDAASNNSVDNVREIRDEVVYVPSQARYKVYIIDEVHMLSTGAFNALLKTLEEPPAHAVFILATTEPHKLPATILSRCQRFDFRRITVESIMERIRLISSEGGVSIKDDAARLIARMADGALRDAISILDQCISLGKDEITYEDVLSVVGIVNHTFMLEVADSVIKGNIGAALAAVDRLVMEGKDIAQFVSDLVMYFRDLLICKTTDMPRDIIEVSADTFEKMVSQSQEFSRDQIISIIKDLSGLESNLKWANHPRVLLEVALIKLCDRRLTGGSEDIMERLEQLEKRVNSGSFSIRPGEVSYSNGNENRPGKGEKGPSKPWEDKTEGKTGGMEKNAPVKKPGAPKGAGGENISPERELKCWNSIVDEIKNMGRMMLYTNILKTRAVEIDEKQVGIVLGEGGGFARMVINKPENLELIQELAAKRLGHEVRIKCIDEESLAKEPKQDEVVERLEILAKKNNIPLNVIDE